MGKPGDRAKSSFLISSARALPTSSMNPDNESASAAEFIEEARVFPQEEPGRCDAIGPWDWLKVIPFQAVAATSLVLSHHLRLPDEPGSISFPVSLCSLKVTRAHRSGIGARAWN